MSDTNTPDVVTVPVVTAPVASVPDAVPVQTAPVTETFAGDITMVEADVRATVTDAARAASFEVAHISDVLHTVIASLIEHLHAFHTGSPAIAKLTELKAAL